MDSNEGVKISQLPELGSIEPTDLLEIISPVAGADVHYDNFYTFGAYTMLTPATYDVLGVFRFASNSEVGYGDIENAAVTPASVPQVIDDSLENRILAAENVAKSYADGVATFSRTSRSFMYLMGRNPSAGIVGVDGGDIPGGA